MKLIHHRGTENTENANKVIELKPNVYCLSLLLGALGASVVKD